MKSESSISEAAVREGKFDGGAYVFYKLPYAGTYTYISQTDTPEELTAPAACLNQQGVILAPFNKSEETPVLFVRPSHISHQEVPQIQEKKTYGYQDDEASQRGIYQSDFQKVMGRLSRGSCRKIVLSRRLRVSMTEENAFQDPVAIFHKACLLHPDCYVSLWWTARSGCWLVATPEILLTKEGELWHTMALAGTMRLEAGEKIPQYNEWSLKNREEQKYVSTYINRQLGVMAAEKTVSETYSSRTGNLVHLRTDFTFRMKKEMELTAVLKRLHPTPAVCGMPREGARRAILEDESSPRNYYAGFSGPVGIDGHTGFYVSLRCMNILNSHEATLYAGGGLLKTSEFSSEWEETCHKMQALLQLFH